MSIKKISNELSVVLPCWNEGKRIFDTISKVRGYLYGRIDKFEIIAVDDGSCDTCVSEIERARAEWPEVKLIKHSINRGKGRSVADGIMAAAYDPVMFMDADYAIPISEVDAFLREIKTGVDIAIASRFVPGLQMVIPMPFYRKVMEKGFRLLRMSFLGNFQVKDTQCGFKMFRRSVAQDIFSRLTIDRWAFDSEVIYLATKRRYKIKELPVHLQNRTSESRLNFLLDPFKMFGELIKIRWNGFKGIYRR